MTDKVRWFQPSKRISPASINVQSDRVVAVFALRKPAPRSAARPYGEAHPLPQLLVRPLCAGEFSQRENFYHPSQQYRDETFAHPNLHILLVSKQVHWYRFGRPWPILVEV